MDYQEIRDLIHNTLSGKSQDHEIEPLEHETMLTSVLDYARDMSVLGPSILRGFATSTTSPDMPDNYMVCYVAMVGANENITFQNFKDDSGNAITVTTTSSQIKYVCLLWNMEYWEKMECSLTN